MTRPTLRELSSLPVEPVRLADSALVLIDCQKTYTQGVMELDGVQAALDETAALLDRARTAGIPVIHIQHDAGAGSPYDIRADIGAIVDQVAPRGDEPVIVKQFPNSFVQTDLDQRLKALGASNLVLAGFMTHMCVNSTARGAFSLGYAPTVVAAATATRTLAGPDGEAVPAAALQAASLAGLADLVAVVAPNAAAIPD
ncbi:cysteine hydrolase [Mycobacterium sp. CBMA293]|uniref:cysteine hydrolase family protein n=1 Tax=unclassified Mycolicibacterium TaxID=2636767 RepID=UPI0012DC5881|nr:MULTISPECIES: cysteine hydrolase family protein [unclassified Mycolicibacterium]MUL46047.1 cysteine hydrolase [Mycolicibacterium sp. CBMA 360]MUL60719.1 cysteine hydrolase [Mycolicibacterium sp. CBMA 335]MUL72534.1 cysteine hydrolase [Mycolicibacterium sp. CBMA 311]MUL95065.1 cysteine hydrolase [Mycolicibacterium sp. CBMA 230]MUM07117.1 cysteine hydrolase [Mycolicibacterium sp. CBMA 213]